MELSEKDKQYFATVIEQSVQRGLDKFYVDREQHYQDHEFIKDVRNTMSTVRTTAYKTFTKGGIYGLGILLLYGFIVWVRGLLEKL